jgi:hypothetical protein
MRASVAEISAWSVASRRIARSWSRQPLSAALASATRITT